MVELKPLALVGGAVTIIAGAYLLTRRMAQAAQAHLTISASTGGTTDPPPGTLLEPYGTQVTVTAKPDSGYGVGTWVIDGVDVGPSPSRVVTMDRDHTVVVTFWQGGVAPPSYPVAIVSMGSVTDMQNYGVRAAASGLNTCFYVHLCDVNWTLDTIITVPMQFKVIDASGKGVPNITVNLWVGAYPDISKYQGRLMLNNAVHTSSGPLQLVSDANGIITVNITYQYGLNDSWAALCSDGGLGAWMAAWLIPYRQVPSDNLCVFGALVSTEGEGQTGVTPAMGNLVINQVNVQVAATSILGQGLAYGGFHIKWV